MSLYDLYNEVPDPRRREGMRTNLAQMFCMITISNLCGHFGGRPIARFAQAYQDTFRQMLNLKHPVPSHVSFSDLLNRVDSTRLIKCFNRWAADFVLLHAGQFISGDGKALASTVVNECSAEQDFQCVVSMFCQQSGLVKAIDEYRNRKENEMDVVRFLINYFDQCGVVFFLDALHTQKKQ